MKTRRKGYINEHRLEQLLNSSGIAAKRIPMSGQASHIGDLILSIKGRQLTAEVKAWKTRFQEYGFLKRNHMLFKRTTSRAGSGEWLVTMTLGEFLRLVGSDAKRKMPPIKQAGPGWKGKTSKEVFFLFSQDWLPRVLKLPKMSLLTSQLNKKILKYLLTSLLIFIYLLNRLVSQSINLLTSERALLTSESLNRLVSRSIKTSFFVLAGGLWAKK